MFCAPGIKTRSIGCFDRSALMRILSDYNNRYPNKKINYNEKMTDTQIWNLIRDGLAGVCGDNEWCWLDQDFLKEDKTVQEYYKPPKPETQTKWLSTTDINSVMKQF